MNTLRQSFLIPLLLLLLTLGAYSGVRSFEFVNYDDWMITENPHIQAGLSWGNISWAMTRNIGFGFKDTDYWAPVAYITHMADFDLHGANPAGHHLTNLFIHTLSVLILFAALQRMTHSPWRSAFVAALFAVHPLCVESVAWIINRKVVLSGLFSMLTLWFYARYTERPDPRRYGAVLLCFALALMSKASIMTLPFALILLDFWPLRRIGFEPFKIDAWRRSLIEKIPLFLLTLASVFQASSSMNSVGNLEKLDNLPLSIRVANALVSYVAYLRKFLWPTDLAFFYPHPGESLTALQVGTCTALLLSITVIACRAWQRFPWLAVGWLWFLGNLVPLIGIVQSGGHGMADRHLYLPILGLALMASWGGAELWKSRWGSTRQRPALALALSILLVLTFLTRAQAKTWSNSLTICEQALRVTQNNHVAWNNAGQILLDRGDLKGATHAFEQAVLAKPWHPISLNNLGLVYLKQEKIEDALRQFQTAHRLSPKDIKTRCNLGIALTQAGRVNEALLLYAESLLLDPKLPDLHNILGNAYLKQGNLELARQSYLQALQLDPHYAEAHYNLGNVLASQGKMLDAIPHYREAVQLKPLYPMAHYNLAICLIQTGKPAEALLPLRKTLEQQPDFQPARKTLAELEKNGVR